MGAGNMTVGLIVDERATDPQAEAIGAIASGAAGGPMAALAPLVGRMAGIERSPISFDADRLTRSVRAGDLVDQACEGVPGADPDAGHRAGQHRAPGEQPGLPGQGDAQPLHVHSAWTGTTAPATATATSRRSPGRVSPPRQLSWPPATGPPGETLHELPQRSDRVR